MKQAIAALTTPRISLQGRVIETTIRFGNGALDQARTFTSKGGQTIDKRVKLVSGKIVVTDTPLTYMRQDFSVKESIHIAGNGMATAEIQLWNLNDRSASEIESKGLEVKLSAGWEGKMGELFSGKIASVTRTKSDAGSTDIITTLYCLGGFLIQQTEVYQETVQNDDVRSFLARLAQFMGLTLSIDSEVVGLVENTTFNDNPLKILTKLGSQFKFTFYWTETLLIVKALLNPFQVKIVQNYSPTNGLLDIPVVTERGVDLKVFLDPQLRSGDGFTLDSKFANFNIGNLNYVNRVRGQNINTFSAKVNNNRYQGVYQALEISHEGSSHENTWQTSISAMGAVNFQDIKQTGRLDIA